MLSLLSGRAEAGQIVLGGYFALQHHLAYRPTHDIDAWWKDRADAATERVIREAMRQVGAGEGMELRERRFGDTLSFELAKAGRRRFSFQISVRSRTIEEPQPSAWPPVLIETLSDNVGAKMNALVNRGAPRDFIDIKMVVDAGLVTVSRCWELWQMKNPGASIEAARRNVLLHLGGLEARRPLQTIADSTAREDARRVRQWFRDEFTKG
ncbi:MAG: nucleotidyl transferase AbiEii/AbiGii toxin family protein [Acidobacteria bacterium]|nr:nucleotidyl transferase AbiEii/AbiGii toxin family protein [Acidobacteriota bacterium]